MGITLGIHKMEIKTVDKMGIEEIGSYSLECEINPCSTEYIIHGNLFITWFIVAISDITQLKIGQPNRNVYI